jgi:outer membrane protein assembly factor BamB
VITTSLDRSVYAFDATNGEQVWKVSLEGAIAAKPVVVGDVVLVGSFDAMLHALDVATGAERWTVAAEDWIWNAPAVVDGTAVFGDVQGNVFGVSVATGETKWTFTADGSIEAGIAAGSDAVYIPVVLGDPQSGQTGQIVALTAESGAELWRIELSEPVFITPVIVNQSIVVATQPNGVPVLLTVYDLDSGSQRWTYNPSPAQE